jgi:hypothetical protein
MKIGQIIEVYFEDDCDAEAVNVEIVSFDGESNPIIKDDDDQTYSTYKNENGDIIVTPNWLHDM